MLTKAGGSKKQKGEFVNMIKNTCNLALLQFHKEDPATLMFNAPKFIKWRNETFRTCSSLSFEAQQSSKQATGLFSKTKNIYQDN